jgi:hypothetical protein
MISGFRHEVNEIFALLGCYLALITDVSGRPVGSIFMGQAAQVVGYQLTL